MRGIRFRVSLVAYALVALADTSGALAVGVCNKGFRDTTAAERATLTAVLEAVKKALPAVPTGWVILGDDEVSVPRSL